MATKTKPNAAPMDVPEQMAARTEAFQNLMQSYADFMTEATQRTLEQALYMRARVDTVMADVSQKTLELGAQEQDILLSVGETLAQQARDGAERTAKVMQAFTRA